MRRTRKFVTVLGLSGLFLFGLHALNAGTFAPPGLEHTREVIRRADGNFDVTCMDGLMEQRTPGEVQRGEVCTHIRDFRGLWQLVEGGVENGVRYCDMQIYHLLAGDRILRLEAEFRAPCAPLATASEDCNGMICSARLGDKFYSFDFSVQNRMTLTRLDNGFSGTFEGRTGGGGTIGAQNQARLETLYGVLSILQVTNDAGNTWLSVCDDDFDRNDALVACRQMGYAGLRSFNVGINVPNSRAFGMDGLYCNGTEAALHDCRYNGWGNHDCGNSEHVQLYCQ
ncbi:MAG TPA: scavenger receptor cysteine-rich domain-containing protein [Bdellovibrionales bacterium]|nr:scavenger receptor cysteine-rich domain-containing protein [Bdellovibrionales bacterium]